MQTVSPLPRDALRGNPQPWMVSCCWAPISLWCWMLSRGLAQVRLYLIMSLSPSQPFGPVGKVTLRKGCWQPPEHRLSVSNSRLWSSSARTDPFTRDHLNLFSLMLIESYLTSSPEVWPCIRLTSRLTRWPPFVETAPLTFAVGRWREKKHSPCLCMSRTHVRVGVSIAAAQKSDFATSWWCLSVWNGSPTWFFANGPSIGRIRVAVNMFRFNFSPKMSFMSPHKEPWLSILWTWRAFNPWLREKNVYP